MTESEFFRKYPTKDYELNQLHRKETGFQDSIEEITYEVVDKKTKEVVARVKRTEVNEPRREPNIFWEE
ncbi:hypothetical protein ACI01D_000697 [Cronobacter sakazakii]|uniref:hypothetical protein n=1 Tax=Enterobacteriaceae TaxID=543 RepID=UPI00117F6608|nr:MULTISPECIES: hypothetical protein [Enterobacteriaceae]ELQ6171999.1 hypothetical protein [Cronobacter dublinensis]EMC4240482.1 hypothetical protein [Cronobacter sakazakii]EMC4360916.1 hypothetical protein [Cronobacter sakazakii]EMD7566574.1 hypothetical protein [Cronobacter sakazakii]MDX6895931.1 hypothetical protein [Klebsiella pneumoniae]